MDLNKSNNDFSSKNKLSSKNEISPKYEDTYRSQASANKNISRNEVYPEKVCYVNERKPNRIQDKYSHYEKMEPGYSPRFGSMNYAGRVLVYGGSGFLGSEIVNYFFERKWWVVSVDLYDNNVAHANVLLKSTDSWQEQKDSAEIKVGECMGQDKFDAILCVAGGWAGGNAASEDLIRSSELCWKSNVWTAVISATLSTKYLKEGGMLVLSGDSDALIGCPEMIGYGISKAAIHNIVISLASPISGLPAGAVVVAFLTSIIDTPMNRKYMPTADFSTWISLSILTSTIYSWASKESTPASGSLLIFESKDGNTNIVAA